MVRFRILLLFSGVLSALYVKSTGPCLCSEHSAESLYRSCSADPQIAQPAAALLFRTAAALQRVLLGRDQCEVDSELGSVLQHFTARCIGRGCCYFDTSLEQGAQHKARLRKKKTPALFRNSWNAVHAFWWLQRVFTGIHSPHHTLLLLFSMCFSGAMICQAGTLQSLRFGSTFPRLPSTEGLLVACISFTPLHQLLHNLVMVVNMSSGDGDGGRGCEIFS